MKKLLAVLALALIAVFTSPIAADAGGRPLTADLSSENEVPDSQTGASGSTSLTLNQGQGEVCFLVETDGLAGSVVAGHIHRGEAGANGGVAVNLGLSSENLSGCVDGIDAAIIKEIRQEPAAFYINVHTTAVPSGEIRGQLSK